MLNIHIQIQARNCDREFKKKCCTNDETGFVCTMWDSYWRELPILGIAARTEPDAATCSVLSFPLSLSLTDRFLPSASGLTDVFCTYSNFEFK